MKKVKKYFHRIGYLHIMYLIEDLYLEYIKDSYNSIKRQNTQLKKWVKDLKTVI